MEILKALTLTVILVVMAPEFSNAKTEDTQIEYFGSVSLSCNREIWEISKVFWITPDGQVLKDANQVMPKKVQWGSPDMMTLNVSKADDDQFGYYTCVMLLNNSEPAIMRWGVNIDGADFNQLEEQYRDSAVVGAIAAAVMLVLVGGACLIWHFRYSKRTAANSNGCSIEDDLQDEKKYRNQAFHHTDSGDMIETTVTTPDEKANGTTSNPTAGPEKGANEDLRM